MIGNLSARSFPNAVVRTDIFEGLVEIFYAKRQTDDEGMERDRHHPPLSRALGVQLIELITNHLQPILRRMTALEDHTNIVEALLVWNRDHLPRIDPHRVRLIVEAPIANVIEPLGG